MSSFAQLGVSHKGNEFQVVFGPNLENKFDPVLLVTTDEEGPVSFWIFYLDKRLHPAQPVNSTKTIQRGRVVNIVVPKNVEITQDAVNNDLTVTIKAFDDKLLTVVGINGERASCDAFLALPKIDPMTKAYEYFVMSVGNSSLPRVKHVMSFFAIITNEDATTITITPTASLRALLGNTDHFPQGRETTATVLNKGYSFAAYSRADLTGTRIVSNKPLTFTSGHQCGNIPSNVTSCDHMVEFLPPTATWGTTFILVPLTTRNADGYRIIASRNNTWCQVTCNDKTGNPSHSEAIELLNAGSFKQLIYPNNHFCCIECNLPAMVMQYSLGSGYDGNIRSDPFMSLIPPLQQYSKDYDAIFFQSNEVPEVFDVQMNLVIPAEYNPSGLRFDGNALGVTFVNIQYSNGSIAARAAQFDPPVDTGVHRVTHSNRNAKFMLTIYGWGSENSYGYVAGMELDPIAGMYRYFINLPVTFISNIYLVR